MSTRRLRALRADTPLPATHSLLAQQLALLGDPQRCHLALYTQLRSQQAEAIHLRGAAMSAWTLEVRAMLRYKGLKFTATSPWLPLHRRVGVAAPALDIDGHVFSDPAAIALELDRRFAAPRLLPADARERALCHALEAWADGAPPPRGVLAWLLRPLRRRGIARQVSGRGTRRDGVRQLDLACALLEDGAFLLGPRPWLCDFALAAQLQCLLRWPPGRALVLARPPLASYIERLRTLH